ncbi:hypothetical protein L1286_23915, partial [Pseudoalteromonas sp. SMS1]|uniref:hypothetical protein n=1 Tax=Pseudoalteromonas sp. SMS1 TaxID=2908894 RepID=UPI001F4869D7
FNPVNGILNSAVNYGADKLFGNDASWNFKNVAVDAFGNVLGNAVVGGLRKSPDSTTQGISQKTKQQIEKAKSTGQSIAPETAEQYMQEVVASKSEGGAVDLTLANVDGGWTISGAGYNDAFVSHGAFDDYSSLVSARTGLADNFGSAWSGSATGRGLNLAFMQAQSESIRNTLSTPITESAAYISGNRRGYVNASIGREGILASYRYQKASMSQFIAQNQAQYNYEQANPMGTWGDLAVRTGARVLDNLSIAGQSVAQLITRGPVDVILNGFETYSFLDKPANRMELAGDFQGDIISLFVAPEVALASGAKAVGGLTSLSSVSSRPRVGSDIVTHQKLLDEYHLQDIERSKGLSRQTGVPMYRKDNLGIVQEFDAYGNEIMYRGFSIQDHRQFLQTGRIPATKETFISPLEAYSRDYDGVLMRHTVQPGTMDKLLAIGGYGNTKTLKYYPNLPHAASGWGSNMSQIKLEGQYKIHVNNGNGIINTGLGQGSALELFNNHIIKSQLLY